MNLDATQKIADLCVECGACVTRCEFLPEFCPEPKKMAAGFLEGKYIVQKEIPFKCNLCGRCATVCREKLNIGEMMMEIRAKIAEEDLGLPGKLKYVANDQKFKTSDAFFLAKPARKGTTTRVFFPGCGLSGYSAELTEKVCDWVLENVEGCGLLLTCCGAPSYVSGSIDYSNQVADHIKQAMSELGAKELIVACPDCAEHFHDTTDIEITSIYEVMDKLWTSVVPSAHGTWMMHDPCKSRMFPEMQDSARSLLEKAGWQVTDPDRKVTKKRTRCCGQGGLVAYADAKWAAKLSKSRADEFSEDFVTYCGACRESLRGQNKPGVHLLDLLFTEDVDTAKDVAACGMADTRNNLVKSRELLNAL